ncbi:hypothetical protein GYMLUDRAFT_240815 [Collybiopsis luxurians FD-317 M1]|nr:hypothetical protein GYMLUDRAFT_240815 [Collybiopsis luxurians FD-317 M1]
MGADCLLELRSTNLRVIGVVAYYATPGTFVAWLKQIAFYLGFGAGLAGFSTRATGGATAVIIDFLWRARRSLRVN